MMGFNKSCTSGTLFLGILIINPGLCLLIVHFKFHFEFKTSIKRFTSALLNPLVEIVITRFVLQKHPSSQIQ